MYEIELTSRFKKDYKLAMKRGLPEKLLEDVLSDSEKKGSYLRNTSHTSSKVNMMVFGNVTYKATGY